MKIEMRIPAKVEDGVLPLTQEQHDEAVAELSDFGASWLVISATNRLKPSDTKGNTYLPHASELVIWELADDAIVASLDGDDEEEKHARALLHWLELGWVDCWINHPHETKFARPFSSIDVTVTLDPTTVVNSTTNVIDPDPDSGLCACRLCLWCRPRVEKWSVKRKGLAELYRRIGVGELVTADEILPLIGAGALKSAGKPAPKKTDILTADEAKEWLALNPRRAF